MRPVRSLSVYVPGLLLEVGVDVFAHARGVDLPVRLRLLLHLQRLLLLAGLRQLGLAFFGQLEQRKTAIEKFVLFRNKWRGFLSLVFRTIRIVLSCTMLRKFHLGYSTDIHLCH